jgi:ribosomal protein L37AE/L43A
MPCHRCGRRQTDPVRGPSPWRRGVQGGQQVLVCPECQGADWTSDLDACPSCGSTALERRLGVTHCRVCPWFEDAGVHPTPGAADRDTALAEDVRAALDKVLHRNRG